MHDLLDYIVKSLVSKPESVKIEETSEGDVVNFNLTVDPEDMGVVIGKNGQTIRAVRKLLITRALAENQNLAVRLNLTEVAK